MIGARLEPPDAILAKLRAAGDKVAKKTLRAVVDQGTKIQLAEAKPRVPKETGLLGKALGRKVKTIRGKSITYGLVGPRRGMGAMILYHGSPLYRNPTRYARLADARGKRPNFLTEAGNAAAPTVAKAAQNILKNGIEDAARG